MTSTRKRFTVNFRAISERSQSSYQVLIEQFGTSVAPISSPFTAIPQQFRQPVPRSNFLRLADSSENNIIISLDNEHRLGMLIGIWERVPQANL